MIDNRVDLIYVIERIERILAGNDMLMELQEFYDELVRNAIVNLKSEGNDNGLQK